MNAAGREALREAALSGVKQARGQMHDGYGGHCGLGVLELSMLSDSWWDLLETFDLDRPVSRCHLCPAVFSEHADETALVAHLNDEHFLDFLGIAEKMPVTDAL